MTPAAFAMAKRVLDTKNVSADEREYWRRELCDAHFFECTKILPLVEALRDGIDGDKEEFVSLADGYGFAPAQKVWLEYMVKDPSGGTVRIAFVFTEDYDWRAYAWDQHDGSLLATPFLRNDVGGRFGNIWRDRFLVTLMYFVIMINQPSVVGRSSHAPHRGLERELLRNKTTVGKFHLRPWTEIKLEISIPPHLVDGETRETRLTGQKCLHFVRRHRREFLDGSWTIVDAHWRGNPEFGIGRSRYRVQPAQPSHGRMH